VKAQLFRFIDVLAVLEFAAGDSIGISKEYMGTGRNRICRGGQKGLFDGCREGLLVGRARRKFARWSTERMARADLLPRAIWPGAVERSEKLARARVGFYDRFAGGEPVLSEAGGGIAMRGHITQ